MLNERELGSNRLQELARAFPHLYSRHANSLDQTSLGLTGSASSRRTSDDNHEEEVFASEPDLDKPDAAQVDESDIECDLSSSDLQYCTTQRTSDVVYRQVSRPSEKSLVTLSRH